MVGICELPQYQHFIIILIVQIFIGFINIKMSKSEKIESNSVEELFIKTIVSMTKRIFKRG